MWFWWTGLGVLGDLYALADVAFVGGGFHGAGLHSVLEPAAFGVPVLFGPRHEASRDASLLLAADAGGVGERRVGHRGAARGAAHATRTRGRGGRARAGDGREGVGRVRAIRGAGRRSCSGADAPTGPSAPTSRPACSRATAPARAG